MESDNTSSPLLDIEQLEPFIDIGLADFLDILDDVINEVPGHLEKIHAAILSGDAKELKARAHSMRGMLANFGCIGMTAVLHDLEYGQPPAPDQADPIRSKLATIWRQSLSALKDWEKSTPDFAP